MRLIHPGTSLAISRLHTHSSSRRCVTVPPILIFAIFYACQPDTPRAPILSRRYQFLRSRLYAPNLQLNQFNALTPARKNATSRSADQSRPSNFLPPRLRNAEKSPRSGGKRARAGQKVPRETKKGPRRRSFFAPPKGHTRKKRSRTSRKTRDPSDSSPLGSRLRLRANRGRHLSSIHERPGH